MSKFKPGDRVSKIKGHGQYNSVRHYGENEDLFLTVKGYIQGGDLFFAIEDSHTFNPDDFELAYIREYNNVLEGILNEEN